MQYPIHSSKHNKRMLILLLLGIFVISSYGAAQAQPPSSQPVNLQTPSAQNNYNATASNLPEGFISRLIHIKYSTELYLSNAIKKRKETDTALANYNTLRWKVDALVYQLSAQMIVSNSPALMRKLDAWSYEKEIAPLNPSIQHYVASLKDIEQLYNETIAPTIYPSQARNFNLTTNVFYLIKDSYSIVKGLSDLKTRKVMALVELLDHTRLLGPGELGKMGTSK